MRPRTDTASIEALQNGRSGYYPDLLAYRRRFVGGEIALIAHGVEAVAAIPLRGSDGHVFGSIGFSFDVPQPFDQDQIGFLETVADIAGQSLDRARLYERERDVARALQMALLPAALPELDDVTTEARYVAGGAGVSVGGDWYDVLRFTDGRVGLLIGDAAGRGVEAAALMGKVRHAAAALAMERTSPAAVLSRVNEYLHNISSHRTMLTCCYVVLDRDRGVFRYSSAGHPPPVVVEGDGERHFLTGGRGVPLGVVPAAVYADAEYQLSGPATIVLYTDGLVERRGETIDVGLERLLDAVRGHGMDVKRLCDHLTATLLADGSDDDVALLAARVQSLASPDRLHLELPVDSRRLHAAHAGRALARRSRRRHRRGSRHRHCTERGGFEQHGARVRERAGARARAGLGDDRRARGHGGRVRRRPVARARRSPRRARPRAHDRADDRRAGRAHRRRHPRAPRPPPGRLMPSELVQQSRESRLLPSLTGGGRRTPGGGSVRAADPRPAQGVRAEARGQPHRPRRRARSFFGIVGPNGAGKTTTLRMATGLLRPDGGNVWVDGIDVWSDPVAAKARIGVLPEDLALFERLSGRELLMFHGALRSMHPHVVSERSEELLDLLGSPRPPTRSSSTTATACARSSCSRPRCCTGRACCSSTSRSRRSIPCRRAIRALLAHFTSTGSTIVFSSHVMELVERLCDHVAVMARGTILWSGPLDTLRGSGSLEDAFVALVGEPVSHQELSWLGNSPS